VFILHAVLAIPATTLTEHPFHHEETNEEHQSHHDGEEPPISGPNACTGEHGYHLLFDLIDESRKRKDTGVDFLTNYREGMARRGYRDTEAHS
jgi:hypothetical protein